MTTSGEEQIALRKSFYSSENTAKILVRDGIPRNRQQMIKLISESRSLRGKESFEVGEEEIEALSYVTFEVHPQQINVRDKLTGKIIASIRR